jgi:hypothetical protein
MTFFAALQNVCFWHLAEIPTRSTKVSFTRHRAMSAYDAKRTCQSKA